MKKLFFILFFAVAAISLMAQTSQTISHRVYGFELGKTTHQEAVAYLHGQGLVLSDQISSLSVSDVSYYGEKWDSFGMSFDSVGNLTSLLLSEWAPMGTKYKDVEKRLKNIYGQDSDDDALALFYIYCFINNIDAVDSIRHSYCQANNDVLMYLVEFNNGNMLHGYILGADGLKRIAMAYLRDTDPNYSEANKVSAVAGVNFGDPKGAVMAAFSRRANSMLKDDGSEVLYSKVSLGGNTYDRATLYFKYDEIRKTKVFIAASFDSNYYTWERDKAVRLFENICATYRNKYTNEYFSPSNTSDDKTAYYGMKQEDYLNGRVTPIIVTMKKSLSQGGDWYYYVTVCYFIGRTLDMYNDEI